jgi:hypothetical protein
MNREVGSEVPPPMEEGVVKGTILSSDETPTRVRDLEFDGYVEMWERYTGSHRLQPRWLLWQALSAVYPDGPHKGEKVFTLTNPKIPQSHGDDLPCLLHPEAEEHDRLVSMGYKPCRKEHIPNRTARDRHIRSSHKSAWAFLQEDKAERMRQEDREIQRDLLRTMAEVAASGARASVAPEIVVPSRSDLYSADCKECGKVFRSSTKKRAAARVIQHSRYCDQKS